MSRRNLFYLSAVSAFLLYFSMTDKLFLLSNSYTANSISKDRALDRNMDLKIQTIELNTSNVEKPLKNKNCIHKPKCAEYEAKLSLIDLETKLKSSRVPVIIGGIGDSGTRGVWQACRDLNIYMGNPKELWKTTKDCIPFMQNYNITSNDGDFIVKGPAHFYNPGLRSALSISYDQSTLQNDERWYMGLQYTSKMIVKLYNSVQAYQTAPERTRLYEHAWGFKHPRSLVMLPFINEVLKNKRFRYIHVLRDGRDVSKGDNQAFYKSLCPSLYEIDDVQSNCVEAPGSLRVMSRMKFWSKMNMDVVKWAKKHLDSDTYLIVRIEDLVSRRPECIKRLAKFLNQKASIKKVTRLTESYSVFNSSYNGVKWTEDQKQHLYNYTTVTPGVLDTLRFFGYNESAHMGLSGSCFDLDLDNLNPFSL
uniref:Sulfotransferase domain-containing protein n=1 Tax=Aplanochytrium stocchinoi TaxID=215587 RepID=A0A7S3PG62_9STRA|mmetsp:Transcript_14131/g.16406  ORF Transcript_14131/g.16406 Transcript_14131/m.16406 type:complete len:420 (+) Transcript_14131:232-1491(+)